MVGLPLRAGIRPLALSLRRHGFLPWVRMETLHGFSPAGGEYRRWSRPCRRGAKFFPARGRACALCAWKARTGLFPGMGRPCLKNRRVFHDNFPGAREIACLGKWEVFFTMHSSRRRGTPMGLHGAEATRAGCRPAQGPRPAPGHKKRFAGASPLRIVKQPDLRGASRRSERGDCDYSAGLVSGFFFLVTRTMTTTITTTTTTATMTIIIHRVGELAIPP